MKSNVFIECANLSINQTGEEVNNAPLSNYLCFG